MLLDLGDAGTFRLMKQSTIERDIVLSNLLASSGAKQALVEALENGNDTDAAIFTAVMASGKLFEILGAALEPEGADALKWTPAVGAHTAQALKKITTPQAKRLLLTCVPALVTGFFLAGLHSATISRKSSQTPGRVRPDTASGATSTSATGP